MTRRPFFPLCQLALRVAVVIALVGSAALRAQAPTPRPNSQKKASELIRKQDPPKVIPRVLEQATPETVSVLISLSKQRAYLKVGEEIAIDTPISSGKRAGMTPKGTFVIIQKNADHRSNIYGDFVNRNGQVVRSGVSTKIDSAPSGTTFRGAPMRWFMRFGDPATKGWRPEGMHTGILPGYPASHGCVRLPDEIAKMIFGKVVVGTTVVIQD
ncbi:MAG: L,D-transpeptidase family protein [Terrimicrobiaceae bacterium]|nr:L,D-transpeptidase family protein [Terrimicrobiaceae bacterium]